MTSAEHRKHPKPRPRATGLAWLVLATLTACSSSADSNGRDDDAGQDANVASDAGVDAATDAAEHDASAASPDASEAADADPSAEDLCSGCASETLDTADLAVHLHHVHLNVSDRALTQSFYQDHFGAESVRLNGVADALHVPPIMLLLEETSEPPSSALPTALQHLGFGAMDPVGWYEEAHGRGVRPDTRGHTLFNTDDTPTVAGPGSALEATLGVPVPACFPILDEIAYMYVLGPDEERIEVWSGTDGRINHVHFTAPDVAATVAWYAAFLGMEIEGSAFFLDDLLFFFEADGEASSYAPTESHVLGHIAFSVTDLAVWRQRADDLDVEVVAEPSHVDGFESFFVRGPDGILIELVQAAPLPGVCSAAP